MNLIYGIKDKPKFGQMLIFAFQQVLAILAATIAVPSIIGNGMSQSAALFGAGIGTIVYQLFTKFRSPVFLGSSFAFIGPMAAAFGGAVSADGIGIFESCGWCAVRNERASACFRFDSLELAVCRTAQCEVKSR